MSKFVVIIASFLSLVLPSLSYSQYFQGRNQMDPRAGRNGQGPVMGPNTEVINQGDIVLSERDNSWCEAEPELRHVTRYEGSLKVIMAPFSTQEMNEPPFPDEERSTFYGNNVYHLAIPVVLNITSDFSAKGSQIMKASSKAGIKLAMKIGALKKERVRSEGIASIELLGIQPRGFYRESVGIFKVNSLEFGIPKDLLIGFLTDGESYWSEPSSLNNTYNYDVVSRFIDEKYQSIESVVSNLGDQGSVMFALDKSLVIDEGRIKLISRDKATCADDRSGFHLCMQFSLERIESREYMSGDNP